MFAIRDQENLAHTHQTTAAGKPLNQGLRALQSKTPGNLKTPFRASKNDENKPIGFQGQKTLLGDGAGKLNKQTFVTPAAPRNRAPLGAKTTNAKANQFKTPAPDQQILKKEKSANRPSTTRRSAKSKIIVATTDSVQTNVSEHAIEEDEPDFGYAPVAVPDLPDPPIDFGYDDTFPQFKPENMFRGYGEIFFNSPKDENGISIRAKREEQEYQQFQIQQEKELAEQIERERVAMLPDADDEVDAMIAAGTHKQRATETMESQPNSLNARTAANVLSPSRHRPFSVANKETASSRAKKTLLSSYSVDTRSTASSVSKNTIGFPKAKKAASIVPSGQRLRNEHAKKPVVKQKDIDPTDFVSLYGEPPLESDMWLRLKQKERLEVQLEDNVIEEDDLANEFFDTDFFSPSGIAATADDKVFQLPMPED